MNIKRLIPVLLGFVLLCFAGSVSAATIYINSNTGDDTTGDGTSGAPYATFHKGYTVASDSDTLNLTGTFDWTDADETGDASNTGYTLNKDLTIQGQGASETFIQADDTYHTADRGVFYILSGKTVIINDVTIRYGNKVTTNYEGGGIRNKGTLTVNRSAISYNYTGNGSSGYGGGINNEGILTVNDSTVDNNYAYAQGGGIANYYTAGNTNISYITNTTIVYNTIAANSATVGGSGFFARSGTAYLTNTTIAFNDSINQSSCSGTGDEAVGSGGGSIYLKNNLIVANKIDGVTTSSLSGSCYDVTDSNITDNGGNIFGKVSGVTINSTSWYDVNGTSVGDNVFTLNNGLGTTTGAPVISTSLADNSTVNGTQTIAVTSAMSITIDNGLDTDNGSVSIPENDQRGFARNGSTDIGAYEYDGLNPDSTPPIIDSLSPSDNSVSVSVSSNLIITFNEAASTGTGSIVIKKTSDNSTVETILASATTGSGSTAFIINPTSDLTGETSYYIQIDEFAFEDTAGNPFAGISDTTTWNFTTEDNTPPFVVSFSPSDDATGVASNSDFVVTFNENLYEPDIYVEFAFGLYKSSDDSAIYEFSNSNPSYFNITDNILTLPSLVDLQAGINYYIKIGSEFLSDVAGNYFEGINDSTTWNFKIQGGNGSRRRSNDVSTSDNTSTQMNQSSEVSSGGSSSSGQSFSMSDSSSGLPTIDETEQDIVKKQTEDIKIPFIDIDNHWAYDYIVQLYKLGLIQGYADNTFRPDGAITRAEMVKIVTLMFGIDLVSGLPPKFKDLKPDMWSLDYINTLSAKGYVTGYSDGIFGPDKDITRAEALKILLKTSGLDLSSTRAVSFDDVSGDDWFIDYLKFGLDKNIIQGYLDNKFYPDRPITRAEVCKIVYLMLTKVME